VSSSNKFIVRKGDVITSSIFGENDLNLKSINLKIIEEFAFNNIEFAFPTQTLNIESNKSK